MATEAEIAVFYSLNIVNTKMEKIINDTAWGTFICSADFPESRHQQVNALLSSGNENHKIDFRKIQNVNPVLDKIISDITSRQIDSLGKNNFSEKYLLDCFSSLLLYKNSLQTIVGVELDPGMLSCIYAGCIEPLNLTLDLVDSDKDRLCQVYDNIRRVFPAAVSRIRLFFGDLPSYAKKCISPSNSNHIIHYNGCYGFNDVIRNLGCLYYVKAKVASVLVANTHLRSMNMHDFAFVDVALYALFGNKIQFFRLGELLQEDIHPDANNQSSVYFLKQHVEGLHIPLAQNTFRYPHPVESWDNFLYKQI